MMPSQVWLSIWTAESSPTWETPIISVNNIQSIITFTKLNRYIPKVYPAWMLNSFGESRSAIYDKYTCKVLLDQYIPLQSYQATYNLYEIIRWWSNFLIFPFEMPPLTYESFLAFFIPWACFKQVKFGLRLLHPQNLDA